MTLLIFTSKNFTLKPFGFKKKIQNSIQYIDVTCYILDFFPMKENFDNLRINKF